MDVGTTVYLDGTSLDTGATSTGAIRIEGGDEHISFNNPSHSFFHDATDYRFVAFRVRLHEVGRDQLLYEEGGTSNGIAVRINADGEAEVAVRTNSDMFTAAVPIEPGNRYHTIGAGFNDGTLSINVDGRTWDTTDTSANFTTMGSHGANPGLLGTPPDGTAFGGPADTGGTPNASVDYFALGDASGAQVIYDFVDAQGTSVPNSGAIGSDGAGTLQGGATFVSADSVYKALLFSETFDVGHLLPEWDVVEADFALDSSNSEDDGGQFSAKFTGNSRGYEARVPVNPETDDEYRAAQFSWKETSSANGWIGLLTDAEGNFVVGAGSDNPEWVYYSGGSVQEPGPTTSGNYETWVQNRITLDREAGTADIEFRDDGGQIQRYLDVPLNSAAGPATFFELWGHSSGTIGNRPLDTWLDRLSLTDVLPAPDMRVLNKGRDYVEFGWNATGSVRWDVYMSQSENPGPNQAEVYNETVEPQGSIRVDGLTQGERYYWRAENHGGGRASSEVVSRITTVQAAQNVQAQGSGENIELTWDIEDNNPQGTVEIMRNSTADFSGASLIGTQSRDDETFTDTNVSVGNSYYYWLVRDTGTQRQRNVDPTGPAQPRVIIKQTTNYEGWSEQTSPADWAINGGNVEGSEGAYKVNTSLNRRLISYPGDGLNAYFYPGDIGTFHFRPRSDTAVLEIGFGLEQGSSDSLTLRMRKDTSPEQFKLVEDGSNVIMNAEGTYDSYVAYAYRIHYRPGGPNDDTVRCQLFDASDMSTPIVDREVQVSTNATGGGLRAESNKGENQMEYFYKI